MSDNPALAFKASFVPVYPGVIRRLIQISAVVAILVMIGWILQIETLKRIAPGVTSMNPLTAIAIGLACGALWCLKDGPAQGLRRGLGLLCSVLVLLIGLTRLSDTWAGTALCPDEVLFRSQLAYGQTFPSRIAPNAALCFSLLGLALLGTDLRLPRLLHPQLLMLPLVCLVWAAVVGYAYNSSGFYQVSQFIPMAPHTALCLLLFAVVVILLRPAEGLMRHIPRGSMGARSMRRLLPACVLVPLVLGGIQLGVAGVGKLDPEQGASLASVATSVVMTVLAYFVSLSLNRIDTRRRQADAELQQRQQHEQRALEWAQSLSELEDTLRSSRDDLAAGAAALLATLVRKCGALQGTLYQTQTDVAGGAPRLRVLALYAYDRPEQCDASFAFGEGMVGQCAAAGKPLRIDAVPDDYFRLRSAFAAIVPRHLLFLPILLDDEVLGVLELASFAAPTEEVERFLKSALRVLAFGIYRYGRAQQLAAELARLNRQREPLGA